MKKILYYYLALLIWILIIIMFISIILIPVCMYLKHNSMLWYKPFSAAYTWSTSGTLPSMEELNDIEEGFKDNLSGVIRLL